MIRLDLWFLIAASASLLTGVGLGIWMGMIHDFQLAPVHAHVNLLGWTSLAVFGLTYRVYPGLGSSVYAGLHFALATAGAFVFPLGIGLSIARGTMLLASIGSIVWLAAVGMFLVALIHLAVRSRIGAEHSQATPDLRESHRDPLGIGMASGARVSVETAVASHDRC